MQFRKFISLSGVDFRVLQFPVKRHFPEQIDLLTRVLLITKLNTCFR